MDTNSDSDTNNINTSIDTSGILANPELEPQLLLASSIHQIDSEQLTICPYTILVCSSPFSSVAQNSHSHKMGKEPELPDRQVSYLIKHNIIQALPICSQYPT